MASVSPEPGGARLPCAVIEDDSTPRVVRLWRSWFDLFFLNWRFALVLTLIVNLLRAVLPQRVELMNSYYSFTRQQPADGLPTAYICLWIVRDCLMQLQVLVILASILLRWLASKTAYVHNRTRMIAAGRDIMSSYMISMACSGLFFSIAAGLIAGLLLPVYVNDYSLNHQINMSFMSIPEGSSFTRWDAYGIFLSFMLSLLTVAEHLSRSVQVYIELHLPYPLLGFASPLKASLLGLPGV